MENTDGSKNASAAIAVKKEHSSPISSPARTTKDAVTLRNQVNGMRFRRYNHWGR